MKSIIMFLLVCFLNLTSQTDSIRNNGCFNEYKNIITKNITKYSDSISKYNECFYIHVYISELDTINEMLRFTVIYSSFDPFSFYIPSHFKKNKNIYVFYRFGNKVDKKLIKEMEFDIISKKEINYFNKSWKGCYTRNGSRTEERQPIVFNLKESKTEYTWYKRESDLPYPDILEDFEYFKSKVKYEVFLKNKLKEYGYK